jgi:hypothetical protein
MDIPPPQSPEEPRRHRARERHERRKERQSMVRAAPLPRPQLRPGGGFKLPKVRIPGTRSILYLASGGLLLLLVILGLGRFKDDTTSGASNAIWIGSQWSYDQPGDAALDTFTRKLRDHRIGVVYAWVGLLRSDNTWSDVTRLDQIKSFVQRFRSSYPDAQLCAWLSIDAQPIQDVNRLSNTDVQQIIADFSQRMTAEFKFDGVVLNVVPVLDDDEGFLALLRQVRSSIGEDALLAVAVPPDWTPEDADIALPPQIRPGTVWQEAYKQRVALIADQMIVTAYNSGFTTAADYTAWVAYQVRAFAGAIGELEAATQLFIGVPAYAAQPPAHSPAVENIQSAINGVRQGMTASPDAAPIVTGLAIYAEWQTTDEDWSNFRALWSG